ncbi:hypothetical protein [Dechloromonas sp. CZR5]|uniref:hypothetical protein n=1 Tax=Dechloromonas sp. CZR5 TaxID=2608630 RepID=UPI00123C98F1|nr:hypothetical protein [Dechloromonas sp. CZR5]
METSFGFFLDPACTTPIVSSVQFVQAISNPSPDKRVVYFGSPLAGRFAVMADDSDITASISGPAASNVTLALSEADLGVRNPGAALPIAARVDGGPAGVVPIYIRALDSTHVSGERSFFISTAIFEEWSQ